MPPDTIAARSGVMLRRGLAVAILSVAGVAAASTAASAAEVADGADYEVTFETDRNDERLNDDGVLVVERGDTLSHIAEEVGLDQDAGWRVLFDANDDIDDPDLILPAQELEVPDEGDELERRGLAAGAPAADSGATEEPAEAEAATEEPAEAEPATEEPAEAESAEAEPEAEEAAAEEPAPAPADSGSAAGDGVWDRLAQCESSGDWSINTGNGYYGGLQFHPQTWAGHGGHEYAPNAHQATREQQIAVAERVLETQGWGAWPACSSQLGLR